MNFKLLQENLIFPNSKISRNNELITMYNSSMEDFEKISFASTNKYDDGYIGKGMYFTDMFNYSKSYGNITKQYYLNVTKPFVFGYASTNEVNKLAKYLADNFPNKVTNTKYFVNTFATSKIKDLWNNKNFEEFFIECLNNPYYIFKGVIMDFSQQLTDFYKQNDYDAAIVGIDSKFQEVVIWNESQIYYIQKDDREADSYYHVRGHQINWPKIGKQGFHIADNINVCHELARNKGYVDPHYYKVILNIDLDPLVIEADPGYWDAFNIAKMLLAKINNTTFEAMTKNGYEDNASPDLVKINNLGEIDKKFLERFKEHSSDYDLKLISNYLKSKGFNCIKYNNYYESNDGKISYLILDEDQIENFDEIII